MHNSKPFSVVYCFHLPVLFELLLDLETDARNWQRVFACLVLVTLHVPSEQQSIAFYVRHSGTFRFLNLHSACSVSTLLHDFTQDGASRGPYFGRSMPTCITKKFGQKKWTEYQHVQYEWRSGPQKYILQHDCKSYNTICNVYLKCNVSGVINSIQQHSEYVTLKYK
jgi:hypothetical protein